MKQVMTLCTWNIRQDKHTDTISYTIYLPWSFGAVGRKHSSVWPYSSV